MQEEKVLEENRGLTTTSEPGASNRSVQAMFEFCVRYGCLVFVIFLVLIATLSGEEAVSERRRSDLSLAATRSQEGPRLRAGLRSLLQSAMPARWEKPVALQVPQSHPTASGQIVMDAFSQARSFGYDSILLLFSQTDGRSFDGVSIYSRDLYRTPWADLTVDLELAEELRRSGWGFHFSSELHRGDEASLTSLAIDEIFPEVRVVPVLVGTDEEGFLRRFGRILGEILKEKDVLVVVCSDLGSGANRAGASIVDRETIRTILQLDFQKAQRVLRDIPPAIRNLKQRVSAPGPLLATLEMLTQMEARGAHLVSYLSSGDLPLQSEDEVTAWAAVSFVREPTTSGLLPSYRNLEPEVAGGSPDFTECGRLSRHVRRFLEVYVKNSFFVLRRGLDPECLRSGQVRVSLENSRTKELTSVVSDHGSSLVRAAEESALRAFFRRGFGARFDADELESLRLRVECTHPPPPATN